MLLLKKLTISTLGYSKGQINAALRPLVEAAEKVMVEAKAANDQDAIAKLELARQRVNLANIVGSSSAAQPGQTAQGDYIKFMGDFAATDCETGEIVATSGVCILPQFIAIQMAEALRESESIEFALRVHAEYDAKSVTGYRFGVETLQAPKITDRMSRLLALAGASAPKLAVPAAKDASPETLVTEAAAPAANDAAAAPAPVAAKGGKR